jgi:hypothetical protein
MPNPRRPIPLPGLRCRWTTAVEVEVDVEAA